MVNEGRNHHNVRNIVQSEENECKNHSHRDVKYRSKDDVDGHCENER